MVAKSNVSLHSGLRSLLKNSGSLVLGSALSLGVALSPLVVSSLAAQASGSGQVAGGGWSVTGSTVGGGSSGAPQVALDNPHTVSFGDIHQAETQLWASITQMRFSTNVDPQTGIDRWVGLMESLSIAPPLSSSGFQTSSSHTMSGSYGPNHLSEQSRFDLQLIGELGYDLDLESRQQQVHYAHRGFLHMHGGFRVHNPEIANNNYSIHFIESDMRLGRAVFRVAVLSTNPSAHAWVLDLDVETAYPLVRTEYAPSGRIVSMLQVIFFQHGPQVQAQLESSADWWDPQDTVYYPTAESAKDSMVDDHKIYLPDFAPVNFALHTKSVIYDPLVGEETLALHYTDGIRSIVQLQTTNTPPLNLQLETGVARDDRNTFAIVDFSDLTSSQLMFQVDDTRFQVIGSADTPSLDGFATDLLRDRVRNR